jgi:hypothetical protein
VLATEGGHLVQLDSPQVVINAVLRVVAQARDGAAP